MPLRVGAPAGDETAWGFGSLDEWLLFSGLPLTDEVTDAAELAQTRFINTEGTGSPALGSYAGDVDADGENDVLVSFATWTAETGPMEAGLVALYFGREFSGIETTDGADVRVAGVTEGEQVGVSLAGGCDFDADGHADFLVGAHRAVDGADGGVVLGFYGAPTGGALTSSDAAFEVEGAAGAEAWQAICAGDTSGDGLDDFLVGAPGLTDVQEVYLFHGRSW
jgi:hypothetical protein